MITLKEWMDATGYRITEGQAYGWQCYGPDAYSIDSWNGDQDGHSSQIVFDTRTQEVYEISTCDYPRERAYRFINPVYLEQYKKEAAVRGADADQAWDEVNYTDLEVEEDMLKKVTGIFNGEDYDTRIQVPLELPDDMLFSIMKMAHEQDITFNEFVANLLRDEMDRLTEKEDFKEFDHADF